ncbi:phosphoethanolamine transferase [Sulfurimonas sp.]|uniref:phosphoethanolamine transferase n=1 Tax=Sulfurimonas sp. TaxID=2022749 RepID=UPI003561F747
MRISFKPITQYNFIIFSAVFFGLFYNQSFFLNVLKVYNPTLSNVIFVISLFFVLVSFIVIIFTLFSSRYTTKLILIATLFISSFTSYFMQTYNVVIDEGMIRNSLQTNLNESMDLFSYKLVLYVFFLGIIPSYYVYKQPIKFNSWRQEFFSKLKVIGIALGLIVVLLILFSKFYASFFREHKPLRYYTNPTYWIYSIGKYMSKTSKTGSVIVQSIGLDAKVEEEQDEAKELVVLVVGEAARADRFSLNNYSRETNPLLSKENDLVSFESMHSCGTSTAVSVPCMFSIFTKDNYTYDKGMSTQNILDVLVNTGSVDILWRDNNSDSKGVALRVPYEDFRTPKTNTVCDTECRDEGMLVGLDKYIELHKNRDILIVLHMMGNHGPAYYKRYTKEYEKFKPVCETNQLEECSAESISNAYDNAILYTDYFLSKVIEFLKQYDKTHEATMFYISDHGESLGESGLYLHGLPYFMAPDNQTHVASIVWFGDGMKEDINTTTLQSYSNKDFTHDNIFHSLLGLFEVNSNLYDKKKDVLHDAKIPE